VLFSGDRRSVNFLAVSLAIIIAGAALLAIGIVQWLLVAFSDQSYGWPALKVMAGLAVIGLGYIALELELIRTGKGKLS
jgi:hypothetical protein